MVYAVSDLHGCCDKYIKLIERLNMTAGDTLYILGDIVDRGRGGMKIIADIIGRSNVFVCMGNHDYCANVLLGTFAVSRADGRSPRLSSLFRKWLSDGGETTFEEFMMLPEDEQRAALSFLNSLPMYRELTVGGRKFFLAHTVPERAKMLCPDRCRITDFIMGEPEYERVYFEDTVIVTGHTPTGFIAPEYTGRIWKGNNHIAIDCGAVFGNPLGCICLDTMEEIYVQ